MTPTPQQLADAYEAGYRDGFSGLPLPELHDSIVEAYACGRRAGTARSGRIPKPKPGLFETEFCRAVLARPFAPLVADVPVAEGEPLPSSEAP